MLFFVPISSCGVVVFLVLIMQFVFTLLNMPIKTRKGVEAFGINGFYAKSLLYKKFFIKKACFCAIIRVLVCARVKSGRIYSVLPFVTVTVRSPFSSSTVSTLSGLRSDSRIFLASKVSTLLVRYLLSGLAP